MVFGKADLSLFSFFMLLYPFPLPEKEQNREDQHLSEDFRDSYGPALDKLAKGGCGQCFFDAEVEKNGGAQRGEPEEQAEQKEPAVPLAHPGSQKRKKQKCQERPANYLSEEYP